MSKSALITGITGQDGSYLAELLLSKGYEVHGIIRRSSSFNTGRLDDIYEDPHDSGRHLYLHYGDLTDSSALVNLLRDIMPDEVYNLGAQSHVKVSFETPEYTGDATGLGAMRLLEAIRASKVDTRIYQASTSELYGSTPPPQSETTPFHPRSPYGVAKMYAYWATVNYREAYDMFASQRHPLQPRVPAPRRDLRDAQDHARRGADQGGAAGQALHGQHGRDPRLGLRARSTSKACGACCRPTSPATTCLATGVGATVEQFADVAFSQAGLDWHDHIEIDPAYFRPAEVDYLLGDPAKAEQELGWRAATHWDGLARLMVDADMQALDDQLSGRVAVSAR